MAYEREKASSDLSSDAEEEYMYAQSLSLRRLDDLRLNLLDEKLGSLGVAEPILFEKSLRGIAQYIKEGKAKKIITMAGAGISFTSGIPDFWSPKYGLYDTLENPQALFDIDVFRRKPRPFFKFARQLFEESFQPTFSHYFIRLLYEKGLLLRHYTQNIDNLERVAGIAEEVLIETRGTFLTSHCLKCRTEYQFEWMKEKIFSEVIIPICEKCKGLVKPDIVFFGENLPKRYHTYVNEDLSQADLLIIMGSSLLSHPFAFLVTKVRKDCPRLVINQEPPLGGDRIMAFLGMESGEDFTASSKRDVTVIGSCDRSCKQLADNLGWLSELIQLRHHRSREMAAREGVTRIKARGYKTAEKEEENNRIQI